MRYLSCNRKSMSLGSLTVLEEATKMEWEAAGLYRPYFGNGWPKAFVMCHHDIIMTS